VHYALFMPEEILFEVKSEGDLAIAALLEKYAITAEDFKKHPYLSIQNSMVPGAHRV